MMTIEEKAKAYDLALETARGYCKNSSLINPMNVIPKIFPQVLSENIGKEVISILKQYGEICDKEKDPCGILDDCISWVEKCMSGDTYAKGRKDSLEDAINDLEILYDDMRRDGCVEEAGGVSFAINKLVKKLEK
jgi:hypothetical protein